MAESGHKRSQSEPFPVFDDAPDDQYKATESVPVQTRRRRRSRRRAAYEEDLKEFRQQYLQSLKDEPNPELDRAFEEAKMSLGGNNNGNLTGNANTGATPFNFFDNVANNAGMAPPPRPSSTPPSVTGGNGAPAGMGPGAPDMPQNAGHQMDLNHLYSMVIELSEVLKNNREMTRGIINGAEELMRRSEDGDPITLQEANGEISSARIAELERALAKEKRRLEIYRSEQEENWKLIREYEDTVGKMTEAIRNYCCNNESHFLAQKRHYNNLLQAERDAHLKSRLERDHWHAQTMKLCGMIRTAYRLRSEEEELPIRVVAGLQNEVRCLRNALGLDPERPEEEYGWEILRHVPPSVD